MEDNLNSNNGFIELETIVSIPVETIPPETIPFETILSETILNIPPETIPSETILTIPPETIPSETILTIPPIEITETILTIPPIETIYTESNILPNSEVLILVNNNLNIDNISEYVDENENEIENNKTENKESIIKYINNTLTTWNPDEIISNNDNLITKINDSDTFDSNITFTSSDFNEVKSFNNLLGNSIDNVSSLNSGSDFSYTTRAKNQQQLDTSRIFKNIRLSNNKNKNKNKKNNDSELDEIDHLYNKLQDYIRYMNIDRKNYIILIVKAMEIIENNHNAENIDKKNTVLKAFNRLVMIDLTLSNYDQTLFLSSISNIIEIIINCSKIIKNNYNSNDNNNDFIYASSGQIIHSLIDKLTTIIIKKKYNSEKLFVNICTITDILMILINKYYYLTSVEKKNIVEQAFYIFIDKKLEYIIDLSKEKKQNLLLALDSIPTIIDIIVAIKNGKYKINRKLLNNIENNNSFFKKLCCCSNNTSD
jgi:hypothetical protein